jgi:hypothetical protein
MLTDFGTEATDLQQGMVQVAQGNYSTATLYAATNATNEGNAQTAIVVKDMPSYQGS